MMLANSQCVTPPAIPSATASTGDPDAGGHFTDADDVDNADSADHTKDTDGGSTNRISCL